MVGTLKYSQSQRLDAPLSTWASLCRSRAEQQLSPLRVLPMNSQIHGHSEGAGVDLFLMKKEIYCVRG